MALFGSKKNKEATEAKPKALKKAKAPATKLAKVSDEKGGRDISSVLKNPRITEKATTVSEVSNVYVFDVAPKATKNDVIEAIRRFYKAEPVKVNMTTVPAKRVFIRGKRGVKSGGKKAYVYFKEGQTIEII